MRTKSHQRTIQLVDFEWPRGPITIEKLMAMPNAQWEHLRTEITKRRQENREMPLATCRLCGGSVFIKSQNNGSGADPWFAHYQDENSLCPWYHGHNIIPDNARAAQYQGQQESALHRWLCNQVAEIVSLDARAGNISVDTYRRATIEGRGRWPDVYFEIDGLAKFAVEIQLSKPFATEIVARHLFYQREGISLIWLFRELADPLPQGFRDILTLQRGNIFTFGDDAIRESHRQGRLLIDCHLESRNGTFLKPKRISLDDINVSSGRSVYLEDRRTEEIIKFCKSGRLKWIKAFRSAPATSSNSPFSESIYNSTWDSARMYVPDLTDWKNQFWRLNHGADGKLVFFELIAILFSIAHSAVTGDDRLYLTRYSGPNALLQMLNSKLLGRLIKPFANLIETFLSSSARSKMTLHPSLSISLQQAKGAFAQADNNHPVWKAAQRIFPEILDGIRRQEMEDIGALPDWAKPQI